MLCECKRRVLTLGNTRDNKSCDLCQKEHAQSLKDRLEEEIKKEEKND